MDLYKVDQCPYCGSNNIGKGYQSGYAAVSSTRSIFKSSKIYYTICSNCGSILHSYVSDPYKFKPR